MAASAAASSSTGAGVANKPIGWFNRSALLIKDPAVSVPFYEKHFDFTLVHKTSPAAGVDHYFLATLEDDKIAALPSDKSGADAAAFVASHTGTFLQLVHEHGSESNAAFKANNGNEEPVRGFGHIAVTVPDLVPACEQLEKDGVAFRKRPQDGRMRSIAFALDPDGYWIEIIGRTKGKIPGIGKRCVFAQTMLRVTDPVKTVDFFVKGLGMTLLREVHFAPEKGDFSLFFLASLPEGTPIPALDGPDANPNMTGQNLCVLELTHNHGTEKEDKPAYHNGFTDPRGFLGAGFTCDDAAAAAAGTGAAAGATEVGSPIDGYKVTLHARS